jgi:hypothetical protein
MTNVSPIFFDAWVGLGDAPLRVSNQGVLYRGED